MTAGVLCLLALAGSVAAAGAERRSREALDRATVAPPLTEAERGYRAHLTARGIDIDPTAVLGWQICGGIRDGRDIEDVLAAATRRVRDHALAVVAYDAATEHLCREG